MMADIRVASEKAKFGELFVLRGLVSDVAGLGRLAQLVGAGEGGRTALHRRRDRRRRGAADRLVSRVVPHDELVPTAHALAARIAANPPLAVQQLKAGLRRALDPDWDALGSWVSAHSPLFTTEDHREGVRSFLEKRPPVFHGR